MSNIVEDIFHSLNIVLLFSNPEAKFLDHDWGDIVDCCIVLSYLPTYAGVLVGQLYAIIDYIHQSGTKNLASEST